ncbi:LysR family transcriptional regulator [Glaciihabitans sp. UYNi722]|uniref:LysR family transcriptional regulator n=1 Tax=Glaciihabitans sp. UYNi722 TaxID=3156344 RepID=UPI0033917A08
MNLRAFLRVASLGTLAAAAAAVGMTQPSVSELVKRFRIHLTTVSSHPKRANKFLAQASIRREVAQRDRPSP